VLTFSLIGRLGPVCGPWRVVEVTEGSPLFVLERKAAHTATGLPVLTSRILPGRTFEPMDTYPDPFSPATRSSRP